MNKKIDLVLVKPGGRLKTFGSLSALSGFAPPLDIGLLAAFIREKGFSVRIIDADAEFYTPEETAEKIIGYNALLVGIFAHTIRMVHAGETLKILKQKAPDIKRLLGGRHPSALPEKTLLEEETDFVCQGEAFYSLIELLNLLKSGKEVTDYKIDGIWYKTNGKVVSNVSAAPFKNLDELPFIAWDLLPMDKYRAHNWQCFETPDVRGPYATLYTSIGCPFNCSYCCVNTVHGGSGIRLRSPEKVVAELDYLVKNYRIKYVRITDDLFTYKPERVMRICDLITQRKYDLNIWCYSRVDTVNETMLKKMRQAGIKWICYGIEAGHQKVLDGVSKRINYDKIKKAVQLTYAADIHIIANFIFGLPDDDLETMHETLNMAQEFNFEYVNFYTAMAWPGSELYNDALKQGIKLPAAWDGYSPLSEDTLPLPTKYLTAAQVLAFRDKAFEEYFSNPSYLSMIEQKFGSNIIDNIKIMLKNKINRKIVDEAKT